jgi:hypothetical protein
MPWANMLILMVLASLTMVSGCAPKPVHAPPEGVHLDVTVFYAPQWQIAEEAKERGLIAREDVLSARSVQGFYDQDRKEIWTVEGEVPESLIAAGHELRHAVDEAAGRENFHGNMIVDLENWSRVNPFLSSSAPLSTRLIR